MDKIKLKNFIFLPPALGADGKPIEGQVGFIGALGELLDQPLPATPAYRLIKFAKQVETKQAIYREAYTKMLNKYGTIDKAGKWTAGSKAKRIKADREYNELLNIEEDYNIRKLRLSDLKGIKIKPKILAVLDEIIEGEE